ncbi:hypothetical protein [Pseudomonas virus PBPA162]|uniref:Uncharacterized protein n=1 Tax=Pseudomonas virus PBPA162 TaxID=2588096 RepID=A0A4Y5TNG2_9CAUD|nr:hypothetical protein PQC32_gp64 [Pseudomonas virus PBPA162]QDB70898.1 hypothetical protein [Pseudomonas virus PBPA162]
MSGSNPKPFKHTAKRNDRPGICLRCGQDVARGNGVYSKKRGGLMHVLCSVGSNPIARPKPKRKSLSGLGKAALAMAPEDWYEID